VLRTKSAVIGKAMSSLY